MAEAPLLRLGILLFGRHSLLWSWSAPFALIITLHWSASLSYAMRINLKSRPVAMADNTWNCPETVGTFTSSSRDKDGIVADKTSSIGAAFWRRTRCIRIVLCKRGVAEHATYVHSIIWSRVNGTPDSDGHCKSGAELGHAHFQLDKHAIKEGAVRLVAPVVNRHGNHIDLSLRFTKAWRRDKLVEAVDKAIMRAGERQRLDEEMVNVRSVIKDEARDHFSRVICMLIADAVDTPIKDRRKRKPRCFIEAGSLKCPIPNGPRVDVSELLHNMVQSPQKTFPAECLPIMRGQVHNRFVVLLLEDFSSVWFRYRGDPEKASALFYTKGGNEYYQAVLQNNWIKLSNMLERNSQWRIATMSSGYRMALPAADMQAILAEELTIFIALASAYLQKGPVFDTTNVYKDPQAGGKPRLSRFGGEDELRLVLSAEDPTMTKRVYQSTVFMSTTMHAGASGKIKWHIFLPDDHKISGRDISNSSAYQSEGEVLFPPGSLFYIVSHQADTPTGGHTTVLAKAVLLEDLPKGIERVRWT